MHLDYNKSYIANCDNLNLLAWHITHKRPWYIESSEAQCKYDLNELYIQMMHS
jgi:hypothetical protein